MFGREWVFTAAAVLANVLIGSTFIASKAMLEQCPAATVTVVRFAIAVFFLLCVALTKKYSFQWSEVRRRWADLLVLGLVGNTGLFFFQITALKHISSIETAATMLMAPVIVLIWELVVRRRVRFKDLTVVLASLSGAAVIVGDRFHHGQVNEATWGYFLAAVSAVCLAISVLYTKRIVTETHGGSGFSVFNTTLYGHIIGMLGLLPFSVQEMSTHAVPTTSVFWGLAIYTAILCSVVATLLWSWALKKSQSIVCMATLYLRTPVALGLGAILLGESLSGSFFAGTTLIIGAIFTDHYFQPRA